VPRYEDNAVSPTSKLVVQNVFAPHIKTTDSVYREMLQKNDTRNKQFYRFQSQNSKYFGERECI